MHGLLNSNFFLRWHTKSEVRKKRNSQIKHRATFWNSGFQSLRCRTPNWGSNCCLVTTKRDQSASTLPNIFQIYTELLVWHCPSNLKRCSLFRPYHLSNRLWLDLLWYVGNVRNAPAPFQKALVGTIYRYITVLLEIIPFEKTYWVRYLAILAYLSKELEVGFQRRIWEQDCIGKNRLNKLKQNISQKLAVL